MGKGDKKTRRGKINQGSYGKTRPKNSKSVANIPVKVLADSEDVKETKKVAKPKAPKATVEKAVVAEKVEKAPKVAKPKAADEEEKPKAKRTKKTEE